MRNNVSGVGAGTGVTTANKGHDRVPHMQTHRDRYSDHAAARRGFHVLGVANVKHSREDDYIEDVDDVWVLHACERAEGLN